MRVMLIGEIGSNEEVSSKAVVATAPVIDEPSNNSSVYITKNISQMDMRAFTMIANAPQAIL
jgi:hypothetical protein